MTDRTGKITLRSDKGVAMAEPATDVVFALGEMIKFVVTEPGTANSVWVGDVAVLGIPPVFLHKGDKVDVNVSAVMAAWQ